MASNSHLIRIEFLSPFFCKYSLSCSVYLYVYRCVYVCMYIFCVVCASQFWYNAVAAYARSVENVIMCYISNVAFTKTKLSWPYLCVFFSSFLLLQMAMKSLYTTPKSETNSRPTILRWNRAEPSRAEPSRAINWMDRQQKYSTMFCIARHTNLYALVHCTVNDL